MKVEKKDLEKSQIELNIELSFEEFKPFIDKGAIKVSKEVKIEGFRPGKVPYDILKQKIGEMTILEEAARLAIDAKLGEAIKSHVEGQPVGQPKVDITKLAPDNPLGFKVVLALLPEVKLGEYKGLKIKERKVEIKEDEVEKALSDLREMRVKEAAVDREIGDKDKAIVDIKMYLDKVPVEGGQNQGSAIIMGKDYVVPGFDKKIIGAKKGETREFSLPYPKDFHMKNLAGKMVEFKVTVKDVFSRELPALDDQFALGFGLKKMEELKDNIKKSLEHQKKTEAGQAAERELLEKLIAKTTYGEIPEMLVESEAHGMMHELEHTVADQGAKFDDYLKSLNKTQDQLMLDLLPEAVKRVKISLLIKELVRAEGIKVTDEEINKQIEEVKITHKDNQNLMKQVNTPEYKSYIMNIMISRKVVEKLKEWNLIK